MQHISHVMTYFIFTRSSQIFLNDYENIPLPYKEGVLSYCYRSFRFVRRERDASVIVSL